MQLRCTTPNRIVSLLVRATASTAAPLQPTPVPRKPGVTDGPWDDQDRRAVEEALADARALANKKHAAKHGPVLLCSTDEELHTMLTQAIGAATTGEQPGTVPAYRAKQLRDAILHGVRDIDAIANIPKPMRAALKSFGVRTGRSKVHHSVTAADGTRKFLLQLHDGYVVETVGIPDTKSGRLTVCVSSQVGCPMRCTFCATGKGGYARNLAPHEIVDQVLTVQEEFGGTRVSNVGTWFGRGGYYVQAHCGIICTARHLQHMHKACTKHIIQLIIQHLHPTPHSVYGSGRTIAQPAIRHLCSSEHQQGFGNRCTAHYHIHSGGTKCHCQAGSVQDAVHTGSVYSCTQSASAKANCAKV